MKSMIKSLKIRSLSKREKVLLFVFTITFTLWLSFKLALKPQAEEIEILKVEKLRLDHELENMNHILEGEKDTRDELSQLKTAMVNIGQLYFPTLDQSQLIYYLEDIFHRNGLKVRNLDFSETQVLTIDDLDVPYIHISIPFEGKYEEVKTVMNDLREGPFKVLIESFSLNNLNKTIIEGEVLLKVFCLENIIDLPLNNLVLMPREDENTYEDFDPFEEEAAMNNDDLEEDGNIHYESLRNNGKTLETTKTPPENKKENLKKTVINRFDRTDYEFISSHESVEGNVDIITENKNNYLRFEYCMHQNNNEEENRAYIDMRKRNIGFKYPASQLYLTFRSFNYSSGKLGARFRTQDGEYIDVVLLEGIRWTGWGTIEFSLPSTLSLYPLTLTHLYYEIPNNREEIGVLLFDKLEKMQEGHNEEMHDFYRVKEKDTLASISLKIYESDKYVNEIIKNNNLSSPYNLNPGKILLLKRR